MMMMMMMMEVRCEEGVVVRWRCPKNIKNPTLRMWEKKSGEKRRDIVGRPEKLKTTRVLFVLPP